MTMYFFDENERELFILEDVRLRVLRALPILNAESAPTVPPETKQRKWHTANAKGKKLQREIAADQEGRGRKSKVSEQDKAEVERAIIDGMSIPACFEKFGERLGVSDAWFYVVRARLRKEGKV